MNDLQRKRQRRATAMPTTDRRPQARRHAEKASEKMTKRRAQQSGAAGWVSDRASRWTLDGPDWDFFERQKYLWNPLTDHWFRMEIEGSRRFRRRRFC